MGVSAGGSWLSAAWLGAHQHSSPKLRGHTLTQPSPIEGEGKGSGRRNNKSKGEIQCL